MNIQNHFICTVTLNRVVIWASYFTPVIKPLAIILCSFQQADSIIRGFIESKVSYADDLLLYLLYVALDKTAF